MRFASKHFDPVIGVDFHFMVPPGPIAPLPNPFIGMLLDIFDYLPVIGSTVMVNGVHRAQAGTGGIALIPHIPFGGVFLLPPENECEMFMGSSTVSVDSDAFGYLALPALSCNSIGMLPPLRFGKGKPKKPKVPFSMVLPTSVVLSIPWGNPVVVGGTPTISLMALAMRAGFWLLGKGFGKLRKLQKSSPRMKRLSDKTHASADKLMNKLRIGKETKTRNRVHRSICTVTGHPIDVATGKVFTVNVDFELAGPLPLRWERVWLSTSTYRGPLGHGAHHAYDLGLLADEGALVIRLADGRAAVFPPLAVGESHIHRAERLTLEREEAAYVLTDVRGHRARFQAVGRANGELAVTSIVAESGGALGFHYDREGRLTGVVSNGGARCSVESDAEGRITGIFAPDRERPGQTLCLVAYDYNEAGDLACARDALGSPITYVYDRHLLVKETSRNGVPFWFEYDHPGSEGRCVRTRGDGGFLARHITYEPEARRTTVVDGNGNAHVYLSNEAGLVTRAIDPLGGEDLFVWSDESRLISETDRAGRTTAYEYTEEGRLDRIKHPGGRVVHAAYDASGKLLSLTGDDGEVWERIDGGSIGAPVEYRSATFGCRWRYELDDRGIPVLRCREQPEPIPQNPLELRYGLLLDCDSIGVPDAEEGLVIDGAPLPPLAFDRPEERHDFDALGRPIRTVDVLGHVVAREFEPEGQLRAYRDREGNFWSFADNVASRARRETDPLGNTTTYGFSVEGLLTEVVDPGGSIHRYEHDARGFHIATSRDGEPHTRMRVGADGALLEIQDGTGSALCSYEVNAAGLRVAERRSSGAAWRFSYDALGRFTRIDGDAMKLAFAYDRSGRRVKEERDGDAIERTFKDGQLTEIRLFDRFRILYGHDGEGGVTIKGPSGATERLYLTTPGLARRETPAGVVEVSRFDAFGRCLWQRRGTSDQESEAADRRYQYTPEGRLSAVIDRDQGISTFEHDAAGRLTGAVKPDGTTLKYAHDAAGNLVEQPGVRLAAGKANRLAKVNDDALTFDERGRLSRREGPSYCAEYTYDEADMLVRVDIGEDRFTAEYDPLGRRTRTTWQGRATLYFWDRSRLAAEIDPDGRLRIYVYADADAMAPLMFIDYASRDADPRSGEVYSIFTDQIGAPVRVEDASGRPVWEASLSPYGRATVAEGASIAMRLRFPGHYDDEEIGLFYNRWRYFSPELGRYIQPDPIDTKGGVNLYAYPSDPLTRVDLFGLSDQGGDSRPGRKRKRPADNAPGDGSGGNVSFLGAAMRALHLQPGPRARTPQITAPDADQAGDAGSNTSTADASAADASAAGPSQRRGFFRRSDGRPIIPLRARSSRATAQQARERLPAAFERNELDPPVDDKPKKRKTKAELEDERGYNPKDEANFSIQADGRAVPAASTSFMAEIEPDRAPGDVLKDIDAEKADDKTKFKFDEVTVLNRNGHQVLKVGDDFYTRENFPGSKGYFMKGEPGGDYKNDPGLTKWLNTANGNRKDRVTLKTLDSVVMAPNPKPILSPKPPSKDGGDAGGSDRMEIDSGPSDKADEISSEPKKDTGKGRDPGHDVNRPEPKQYKGGADDQANYKNKGERVELDDASTKTRGEPWQNVEKPDRRKVSVMERVLGEKSQDWPKGTPNAGDARKDRPNPQFSERSHLRANRAGGAMHSYNGVPASYHQNTESTAIEEVFSDYAKKNDLITKHEAYPDGTNTSYIRVKAYVRDKGPRSGSFVKVLDHVMDADRGPIEKPAVALLKEQVGTALKERKGLGGKGLPDNKVPNLDRATYGDPVSKGRGGSVTTEIIDKQMTDHAKNNWKITVTSCGK